MDYGSLHGQVNLKVNEKCWSEGGDSLWVRDSCRDGGKVSVGELTGSQSNGQLSKNLVLTEPRVGPSHYSVTF